MVRVNLSYAQVVIYIVINFASCRTIEFTKVILFWTIVLFDYYTIKVDQQNQETYLKWALHLMLLLHPAMTILLLGFRSLTFKNY